jgi:dTDP-glucose 4,6-dehydratase
MITGCAGFIGSHATDYFLQRGHEVIGLDALTYAGNTDNLKAAFSNKDFEFFEEDICNTSRVLEICKRAGVEWIFNFAAETHVDNSIFDDTGFIHSNMIGVQSLLKVCQDLNVKLFQISTDEVYGSTRRGSFSESDKLTPKNPYSATKAAAEHLITSYANTYKTQFIIVRPSNNFGPRQHDEKFLPTIIRSLSEGKKIPIYGDGKNVRDWLFVKDNVKIIYDLWITSEPNQIYNISLENEKQNLEIVSEVVSIMQRDLLESISFVEDRPGHDFRYSINNQKIKDLGLVTEVDFQKNLRETVISLVK